MTRTKAATIHLLISAMVVSTVFAIIILIWYPGPTFRIAGAVEIVFVLVGVDIVLGPLLTLLVYKKDKPGLKFDLSVIALVQVAALIFGAHTFYTERPHYMVFVVDRFNIVSDKYIDKSKLRYDELKQKPFADVIRVFARRPEDTEEFQAFLDSVLFDKKPDLEGRPEYWEPYEAGRDIIAAKVKPLSELEQKSKREEREIRRVIRKYQNEHPRLGYLPVATRHDDIGMVMDMDTLEPLGILEVDPWEAAPRAAAEPDEQTATDAPSDAVEETAEAGGQTASETVAETPPEATE